MITKLETADLIVIFFLVFYTVLLIIGVIASDKER